MSRLAFVSSFALVANAPSPRLASPRRVRRAVQSPRRLRAVACDRDSPVSSATTPTGGTPEASGEPSESEPVSKGVSRTLLGRVFVEVLSLVVGAALLLVVVVWRASQVASQAAWRALLWLSNLRRLGKWAFARAAQRRPPAAAALRAARDAFSSLLARLPVVAPSRSAAGAEGQQLVSKEDLDHVQREIDRMKDLIDAKEGLAAEEGARGAGEAVGKRRLVLVRHAKTMWERDSDIPDHDRVLSPQGKEEARLVGSELTSRAWLPNVVLCSDAVRTVQTLSLLNVPEKEEQADTLCTESLYYAVTGEEMAVAVDDALGERGFADRTTLMVVCHNPGCEELVEQLTGHRPEMGTGCAALLEFDDEDNGTETGEQAAVFRLSPQQNQWHLVEVLRPSSLAAASSHKRS